MEPDLHVFARAPAGVPGAHAGNHAVGPGQGEGGGEWIPGRGERTSFCKLISFFSAGRSLLWRACVPRSLADPYRAGDGPPGRRAALVQATNPRCVLHPTSTCLPEHSTSAVPWRESDTATAEYGFSFLFHWRSSHKAPDIKGQPACSWWESNQTSSPFKFISVCINWLEYQSRE